MIIAALACALGACESPMAEPPAASLTRSEAPDSQLSALTERVAFERHRVEQRLRGDWELPQRPKDSGCTNLASGELAKDTLVLDVRDARPDGRQLFSLDLTNELTSSDLRALEPLYRPGTAAKARRELVSTKAGEEALSKLSELAERRYAAVFHVTHLAAPKFFHDPKKRFPEWSPGWMMGWLALHQLGETDALCQLRIEVRSDTRDAPRERRLRETTQRALLRALAARFHDAGERAQAKLNAGLIWPHAPREREPLAAAP